MRVSAKDLESFDAFLTEGMQLSQIEKAYKDWRDAYEHVAREGFPSISDWGYGNLNPSITKIEDFISMIAQADPTSPDSQSTQGKYTGWLLSRFHSFIKGMKTRKWALQKSDEIRNAVLNKEVDWDDVKDENAKLLRTAYSATYDNNNFTNNIGRRTTMSRVKDLLRAYEALSEYGRLESNGISKDIFEYKSIADLYFALAKVPDDQFVPQERKVKNKEADPWKISGSRIVYKTDNIVVYEINAPRAAMYHARGTNWCFKDSYHAGMYTDTGPLYVIYTNDTEVSAGDTHTPVPATNLEGWYKVVGLTFDYGANHLLEIRDTNNDWIEPEYTHPDIIKALKAIRHGRDRGMEQWLKNGKSPSRTNVRDSYENWPGERITIAEYDPEEDIPEEEKVVPYLTQMTWHHPQAPDFEVRYDIPPELQDFLDEYDDVEYSPEENSISISFWYDPEELANFEWLANKYAAVSMNSLGDGIGEGRWVNQGVGENAPREYIYGNEDQWIVFYLGMLEEEGKTLDELKTDIGYHFDHNVFDQQRVFDLEEQIARAKWMEGDESYEFQPSIQNTLSELAWDQDTDPITKEDNRRTPVGELLGIPFNAWVSQMEHYFSITDNDELWDLYKDWAEEVGREAWDYHGKANGFTFSTRLVASDFFEDVFDEDMVSRLRDWALQIGLPTSQAAYKRQLDVKQGQQFIPGVDPQDRYAWYESEKVETSPCGLCFPYANNLARQMLKDGVPEEDIIIAHGNVQDPPPSRQTNWYPHAWVESQGKAYDWQMSQSVISLPIETFYELRKPQEVKKYGVYEAMVLMVRHQHHGPWEEPIEEDAQDPEYSLIGNVWTDDRVPAVAFQVIQHYADDMAKRCDRMHSYDACVQWMDILLSNDFDVQMYKGNGDHYWLAVGGGIMDPRADQIAGFPNLSPSSYNAEKVVWNGNARVDQDVLNEISQEPEDLMTRILHQNR